MTAPVQVGDVVAGKYEVERIMAAGGMGVVVAARHRTLEQRVALKFMLASQSGEAVPPEAIERFLREGRAAVRLRGENVARTLDVDTLDDGTPYLVMEYLEGMSLGEHLDKHRPLPLAESVDYVLQACVAMAEAHRAGIIHRDLKPDNLFLTRRPDGSPLVKVLDFGISKVHAGPQQEGSSTQTSMIMGSPAYMPPEQIRSSREVDARSDIWALGVILYECTSGQKPYHIDENTSVAALMAQVLYEEPRPLADVAPYLPQAFCQVVDRCLRKAPEARYQSVGELATGLLPFASAAGRATAASVHALIGGGLDASREGQARADTGEAVPAQGELSLLSTLVGDDTVGKPEMPQQAAGQGVGAGELEIESLDHVEPVPLSMNREEIADAHALPRHPRHEQHMFGDHERGLPWWLHWSRVLGLAVAAGLGTLTVLLLMRGTSIAPVVFLDELAHTLGYRVMVWAGQTTQVFGGPMGQILIPALMSGVLRAWLNLPLAALVTVWWMGESLVHSASYMDDVMLRRLPPIVDEIHAWSYLMNEWEIASHAGDLAVFMHWSGVVIMVLAVGYILHGALRR